jgi:hypothetical protein
LDVDDNESGFGGIEHGELRFVAWAESHDTVRRSSVQAASADEPLEYGVEVGGLRIDADGELDHPGSEPTVVVDQRAGAFSEKDELLAHGIEFVVPSAGAVAAGVGTDSSKCNMLRAHKMGKGGDVDQRGDATRLTDVAGEAVEDEERRRTGLIGGRGKLGQCSDTGAVFAAAGLGAVDPVT